MKITITDRIDSITRIPEAYLKAAPPAPRSVKIEISPRCNYRCGFCALRTREMQPKWDMDFELFKRITREMRVARRVPHLERVDGVSGGGRGVHERGLDSLKWSVNAADEAQFEEVMGVAGKLFHRALENVKSAWDVRQNCGSSTGLYASSIRYDGAQLAKPGAHRGVARPAWTMGDLTKVPFMDAWNSQPFVQLRAAHLKKDVRGTVCENCIAYGGA